MKVGLHQSFALAVLLGLCDPTSLHAQQKNYVGALGGFAILSGDASSRLTVQNVQISQYKPKTGPALNLFAGRHLSNYLSVQASYIWNRNGLVLTSTSSDPQAGSARAYQENRNSSQH